MPVPLLLRVDTTKLNMWDHSSNEVFTTKISEMGTLKKPTKGRQRKQK